jgi:hypothetical protein
MNLLWTDLDEALSRLRRYGQDAPRLVLLLGASGSGKSSLMRAGVVPRLRRQLDEWLPLRPFRPKADPVTELALAIASAFGAAAAERSWQSIRSVLANAAEASPPDASTVIDLFQDLLFVSDRPGATLLITMDQAEELLGPSAPPVAGQFLTLLRATLAIAERQLLCVATLRSDFLGAFQKQLILPHDVEGTSLLYQPFILVTT